MSYEVTTVDVDRARPERAISNADEFVQELLADGQDFAVVQRGEEVTAYIASQRLDERTLADARGLAGRLTDVTPGGGSSARLPHVRASLIAAGFCIAIEDLMDNSLFA